MSAANGKKIVILCPAPQPVERIFRPSTLARLHDAFEVVHLGPEATDELRAALPEAFAVIGQPDLTTDMIASALQLRALCNVEGNFYPNVDYAACFQQGIHVLGCGPAYAQAVAEYALALALDLARGISREDRAFRSGHERYLGAGNSDAVLLRHAPVGFLGYGNLGRTLHRLLTPFSPLLRVYDPWLPDAVLADADVIPSGLAETLQHSRFLFVLATATDTNQHLLGAAELAQVPPGARLVLVSRAAVVDYDALTDAIAAGRLLAAIDVWPEEPMPADHPLRTLDGTVLSAHRAGGIPAAFAEIGDMVVDDLQLVAQGLPPVRMQVAARELVDRYRNRPAG